MNNTEQAPKTKTLTIEVSADNPVQMVNDAIAALAPDLAALIHESLKDGKHALLDMRQKNSLASSMVHEVVFYGALMGTTQVAAEEFQSLPAPSSLFGLMNKSLLSYISKGVESDQYPTHALMDALTSQAMCQAAMELFKEAVPCSCGKCEKEDEPSGECEIGEDESEVPTTLH